LKKNFVLILGMPMIYTIVSALVEKLNKENDDRKTAQEKERERTRALEEEEEMVILKFKI
jgi:hypothetical protein